MIYVFRFHIKLKHCPDKISKQRMRAVWPRLKFRVELDSNKPRMAQNFDNFNQFFIGRQARKAHSSLNQSGPIAVVNLITMAMSLIYQLIGVDSAANAFGL